LIRYGLIRNCGPLAGPAVMNIWTRALMKILTERRTLLKQYQRLFELKTCDCDLRTSARYRGGVGTSRKSARALAYDPRRPHAGTEVPPANAEKVPRLRGHRDMVRTREINWSLLEKADKAPGLEFRDAAMPQPHEESRGLNVHSRKTGNEARAMMPVRDMVIFPQQMTPFIVGAKRASARSEEALAATKDFPFEQHDASVDDQSRRDLRVGHSPISSERQASGRQYQSSGGAGARSSAFDPTKKGFFRHVRCSLRASAITQVDQPPEYTGLYEQFIKLSQA